MRDTTLYQHLLGLTEPWSVARVDLDVATQRVDVWVEHPKGLQWLCPECGASGPLHDHAAERVWRHLDSCQYQTHLHARIPVWNAASMAWYRSRWRGRKRGQGSRCSSSAWPSTCWVNAT